MTDLQSFLRPLCPDDWTRFDRYAPFVKSVYFVTEPGSNSKARYHPDVIATLAVHRLRLNILPSLKTLVWDNIFSISPIPFFSSSLMDVSLVARKDWKSDSDYCRIQTKSNIHTLAILAPKLRSFTFDGYISFGEATTIGSYYTSLEYLTITSLSDYDSFVALMSLPRLRKLHLRPVNVGYVLDGALAISAYSNTLAQIVWDGAVEGILAILEVIPTPNAIESIALGNQSHAGENHYRTLFQLLSRNFSQLQKFKLAASDILLDGAVPNTMEVTLADLEPLKNLAFEELDLQFPIPLSITLQELESFARIWPNIKVLKLMGCGNSSTLQMPPTQVLQIFNGESFPVLREVGIAFNASSLRGAPQIAWQQSDTLVFIDVRGSQLTSENVKALALLLGSLFPNLRNIHGAPHGDAAWAQVAMILELMSWARLDERRRMKRLEGGSANRR
jgi:hypothetical protein